MPYTLDEFSDDTASKEDFASCLAAEQVVSSVLDDVIDSALRWFAGECLKETFAAGLNDLKPRELVVRYSKSHEPSAELFELENGGALALISVGLLDALVGAAYVVDVLGQEEVKEHIGGGFPVAPERVPLIGVVEHLGVLRRHVLEFYGGGAEPSTLRVVGECAAYALVAIIFHEFTHFLCAHKGASKGSEASERRAIELHADLLSWWLLRGYIGISDPPKTRLSAPPKHTWSTAVEVMKICCSHAWGLKLVLLSKSVWVSLAASSFANGLPSASHLSAPARWRAFCNSRFTDHIDHALACVNTVIGGVAAASTLKLLGIQEGSLRGVVESDMEHRDVTPDLRRAALRHIRLGQEQTIFRPIIPGRRTYQGPGFNA